MKILDSYDTTDNDAVRSMGRVRTTLSGSRPQPNDWLFSGGYGRGVDIYESGECVVPQSA